MQRTLRRNVYEWVEFVPRAGAGDRVRVDAFDVGMIALIVLNVVAVILETEADVHRVWWRWLYAFEAVSIAVFTIEYLLRLWACKENPRYAPVGGRVRFMVSPMAIVDLLAIAPFYVQLFSPGGADMRFVLALRLFRILRVLKIGRYSSAIAMLGRVVRNRVEELAVIVLLMAVTLVVAAGLMYYAENPAQPDKFPSIGGSLWWAVITLTTIGYGDVYPVTTLGKVLGGAIAVCGIGFVALPTAVVSAGLAEELAARRKRVADAERAKEPAMCPHCGKAIEGHAGHA
ncbi:MAG: ion transporter [Phycisphaerae bacterium]|nr:ion transporter [Tepidisphaeraceae bacterium]